MDTEEIKLSKNNKLPNHVLPSSVNIEDELNKMKKSLGDQYESIYQLFFDKASDIICLSKSNGLMLMINQQFTQILGYTPEDIVNTMVIQYVHPDDVESTINAQNKVHHMGYIYKFENRWKTKDNNYVRLEWTASEIIDGNYIAIARVKDEIDLFLSRVTHQLRTPLNSIIGFTDILEMNENLSLTGKNAIQYIKASSQELLYLINNILDLTRITTTDLINIKVNLKDLLLKIIKDLEPQLKKKNIKLTFIVSYLDNCLTSESIRLNQIFTNILQNAIKYNKKDGSITINSELHDNTIKIMISDTGIGIPEKFMGNLFQPFERCGIQDNIPGSGLGLSIAKKTIELLGGEIKCQSIQNQGSTFTIIFPIDITEFNPKLEKEVFYFNQNSLRYKMVYVEDHNANISLLKMIMSYFKNIDFYFAKTATEGLEMIIKLEPEFVLLDYHLPDYNADVLYQQIKDLPCFSKIQFLTIISADASVNKIDTLVKLGIKNYIIKPINIKDFRATIQNKLNQLASSNSQIILIDPDSSKLNTSGSNP